MLALRPVVNHPQYLGCDFHISMGLAIEDWKFNNNQVQCKFNIPRTINGQVFIFLPSEPKSANLNHNPVTWIEVLDNIYQFHVQFNQEATLEISL
jgi:hypothetical protein